MDDLAIEKPSDSEEKETKNEGEMDTQEDTEAQSSINRGPCINKAIEFGKSNRPHRLPAPTQKTGYRLSRPGELKCENGNKAMLYKTWGNGIKHLDEFGIGISLYFRQVLFVAFILALCVGTYGYSIQNSILKINMDSKDTTPYLLYGSVFGSTRFDLDFISYGVPDLAVVAFLLICLAVAKKAQDKAVQKIDEAQQTPQDYSVCITNPPENIVDPDVYYDHFSDYGDIVFITVCLNNGIVMKKVREKIEVENRLIAMITNSQYDEFDPKKADILQSSLPFWQQFLQRYNLYETKESLRKRLKGIKCDLHGLGQRPYIPVKVYITFNTEKAQRKCLQALSSGTFYDKGGDENMVGGKLVNIKEAKEPSSIIWENLHHTKLERFFRLLISLGISAAILAISFSVINSLFGVRSIATALFIAFVNGALPVFMKIITYFVEVHTNVVSLQSSMMIKLVLARSINSAVLLYIASPFEDIFTENVLSQVLTILLVDAFVSPAVRLLNVYERLVKKFVAPRQTTQAGMDRFFFGAEWNIAERYTDMLKTMFVGLFYSAVLPTGLVITVFGMIICYWVDKYCLFRLWKRAPAFDATLAAHSRMYMVGITWVHVMISRVFYANWPYINRGERSHCNFVFCKEPKIGAWTNDQKILVMIYGYLGIFLFSFGLGTLCLYYLHNFSRHKALCGYKAGHDHSGRGEDIPVEYRNVSGIECYVPLLKSTWLVEPLFGLDLNKLPINAQRYLPVRSGGTYTASELSMNTQQNFPKITERERNPLFSTVKYYPSPDEEIIDPKVFAQRDRTNTDGSGTIKDEDLDKHLPIFKLDTKEEAFSLNTPKLDPKKMVHGTFGRGIMIPINGKLINENSTANPTAGTKAKAAAVGQIPLPKDPNSNLPDGWTERMTSDGRTFYANEEKHYTQWERPVEVAEEAEYNESAQLVQNVEDMDWYIEGLHYETKIDAQGRMYFEDHVKCITTWERPSGPIRL
mmetsp:Transcript_5867/g.8808  ORF Transcript_5867/g.8808 Transcript_5867/m.8808 type:complete len:978 (+) Transcript_5867:167-3100(+)